MSKLILLTQGQRAMVDDWNYDYLMQWKWHAVWNTRTKSFYAKREQYKPFRKKIHMARVIMKTPDNLEPDHINRDTLDNRECNLRNVTHAENMKNRRNSWPNIPYISGKTNERNISIDNHKYYKVKIIRKGKIYQKNFKTLQEAIVDRDMFFRTTTPPFKG